MRMVRIDPPGTWCQNHALLELVAMTGARTFCEVGCGSGMVARELCDRGLGGVGIDFSEAAIAIARDTLASHLEAGHFELRAGDFLAMDDLEGRFDLALAIMVMEHVEDDVEFARRLAGLVRPGGHVIIGVPARQDRWGIEDQTAGHFRRYERAGLESVLRAAGLVPTRVWSISVPVANLLFHAGNLMIRTSSEVSKRGQSARAQTESSGIREIPFKTVFPAPFRLLLNRVTMAPFTHGQRLFYNTGLGLTLFSLAARPGR